MSARGDSTKWGRWRGLARHQTGAVVTTAVDFTTMIALVQLAHASAELATACGAFVGGVTNFTLGRRWIFAGASKRGARTQGLRYLLVSGASLAWNTVGEWLLHAVVGVPYVLARAVVAIAVSLLWNYPMQRGFVFAAP